MARKWERQEKILLVIFLVTCIVFIASLSYNISQFVRIFREYSYPGKNIVETDIEGDYTISSFCEGVDEKPSYSEKTEMLLFINNSHVGPFATSNISNLNNTVIPYQAYNQVDDVYKVLSLDNYGTNMKYVSMEIPEEYKGTRVEFIIRFKSEKDFANVLELTKIEIFDEKSVRFHQLSTENRFKTTSYPNEMFQFNTLVRNIKANEITQNDILTATDPNNLPQESTYSTVLIDQPDKNHAYYVDCCYYCDNRKSCMVHPNESDEVTGNVGNSLMRRRGGGFRLFSDKNNIVFLKTEPFLLSQTTSTQYFSFYMGLHSQNYSNTNVSVYIQRKKRVDDKFAIFVNSDGYQFESSYFNNYDPVNPSFPNYKKKTPVYDYILNSPDTTLTFPRDTLKVLEVPLTTEYLNKDLNIIIRYEGNIKKALKISALEIFETRDSVTKTKIYSFDLAALQTLNSYESKIYTQDFSNVSGKQNRYVQHDTIPLSNAFVNNIDTNVSNEAFLQQNALKFQIRPIKSSIKQYVKLVKTTDNYNISNNILNVFDKKFLLRVQFDLESADSDPVIENLTLHERVYNFSLILRDDTVYPE